MNEPPAGGSLCLQPRSLLRAFEDLQIRQILGPRGCGFVTNECVVADVCDSGGPIQTLGPRLPRFRERNTVDRGEDVHTVRRCSELQDPSRAVEVFGHDTQSAEPELLERRNDTDAVLAIGLYEQVEVLRVPRLPAVCQRGRAAPAAL